MYFRSVIMSALILSFCLLLIIFLFRLIKVLFSHYRVRKWYSITMMAIPDRTPAFTPDVRFLLLPMPEFSMLSFGGFTDKLRFSADDADFSRQRYCSWQILGMSTGSVSSSSGIEVNTQLTPQQIQLSDYDYLVIFGSRTAAGSLKAATEYKPFLMAAARQGVTLVAIDNACFLLAAAGLLYDCEVALHWRHAQEFASAFPRIRIRHELLYCFSHKRVTCAGGSAAIELAVELLARHCGRVRALKGLADMLVDETRGQVHNLKSLESEAAVSRPVSRAIALMRNLLAEHITVEDIAAEAGLGRRQLDRLFLQYFGLTTHGYWMEMKLQHLHWRLLNSGHNLAVLADEVGIPDTSYLCRVVRKRFGQSPASLRKSKLSDS